MTSISKPQQVTVNQPAPAPIRAHTHKQQRLFLGPLPAASLASERVNKARKRYWSLGSKARIGGDSLGRRSRSDGEDDAGLVEEMTFPRALHFSLPGFRRSRSEATSIGPEEEEEFDTTVVQPSGPFFTIGQEFTESTTRLAPAEGDHGDDPISPPIILVNEAILKPRKHDKLADDSPQRLSSGNHTARPPPKPISRPSLYPRTTTDRLSYQTARSHLATSNNDAHNNVALSPGDLESSSRGRVMANTPGTIATTKTGTTDFFSARSEVLIGSDDDEDDKNTITGHKHPASIKSSDPVLSSHYETPLSTSPAPFASPGTSTSPRFSTKLRSALRRGSNRFRNLEQQQQQELGHEEQEMRLPGYGSTPWGKKRTVQFPPEEETTTTATANATKQPALTSIQAIAPASDTATTTRPSITPSPSTSASDPTLWSPPDDGDGDDEQTPAPPREVLARTGSAIAGTSAGIVQAAKRKKSAVKKSVVDNATGSAVHVQVVDGPAMKVDEDVEGFGDDDDPRRIILRDRMLVAVGRNSHPHLTGYNEREARRKPSERVKAIEEYLVVYRKGWIELHKEWSTPIGRTFRKHKRLCFAIPLLSTVTTFSMFSRRDLSFALCLDNVTMREEVNKAEESQPGSSSPHTMEAKGKRQKVVNKMKKTKEFKWVQERAEKNRSLVFVFIGRERTRMLDWCWDIWKELGGQIPEQLRVHIPIFESVIDLPRPREDYTASPATLQAFSRSQILLDVFTTLRNQLPDYDEFVKREMARSGEHSLRLELAWETGMHLDWIPSFAEWSVEDQERRSAVLSGLTMDEAHDPSELLLLPIRHDTNDFKLSDGMQLSEPCAVEGVLRRMSGAKAASGKRRVFVHSQSGYLLSTSTRHAQSPLPPYLHPVENATIRDAYFADEQVRTAHNMLHSDGLIDFRSIVRIVPPKDSLEEAFERENTESWETSGANTKLGITLQHLTDSQFVVVLSSDEIVWLEADDNQVADEWVRRLTALCKYWSHRQRVDARDRMNLINEMNVSMHTAGAADSELARDSLTCRIANWCPFERCNTVIHCGRLYLKQSQRSQFRESFCILVPGYLIHYRVTADCYHKRETVYSLSETYIYSGYLAQTQLHDRLKVDDPLETRLYQDGLSSADGVEDCTFVLWIRRDEKTGSHTGPGLRPVETKNTSSHRKAHTHTSPRLAKRPARMIVCRARCKLERDLWIRALSIEIETHSREDKNHQEMLRYSGTVST